ncbi:methionine adenosyltransferase [Halolamina sp. CBA1230]|uniref:methionine adenosyltransferase n=1 Tax=Halolamina sp. CBA1230 TaxID=1853690 RepID=UPI0009A1CCA0|nr:methionine adenosyltransferase [Halolamina sp. CBA1230]QKY19609.1 methionine adenosyltransferase [Halolamina sp. CBA1230]
MTDAVSVTHLPGDPVARRPAEFVERKGVGHPDSLCDGVAEAVSRTLSRFYRDEFDRVLHHNTDKVHLGAGRATPEYGGGEVVDPIYLLVGGRATTSVNGRELPIPDLARDAAREYVLDTVPELDAEDLVVETRIGRTSGDLASLFDRGEVPLANDTSFGVGHGPGSPVERFVRTLEPRLHAEIDAVGKDVKLMASRRGDAVDLTVAAAVVDRHVAGREEYHEVLDRVDALAREHAADRLDCPLSVRVNAADDDESVYLTTTGLSAEAGDDGAVGRGNRANGLITPARPMSLEATAGKNPVTHVGKLYNLLALRIAGTLSTDLGAAHSCVQLLSRIGSAVDEPHAVDVETTVEDGAAVRDVVDDELAWIDELTEDLLAGDVDVF